MLHIQTNRAQSLLLTSPPPHAVGRRSAAVSMVLLVVLAWLTLLIFNATLLVVPVSVGWTVIVVCHPSVASSRCFEVK